MSKEPRERERKKREDNAFNIGHYVGSAGAPTPLGPIYIEIRVGKSHSTIKLSSLSGHFCILELWENLFNPPDNF